MLFLGGLLVALSAPVRDSQPLISSILFYFGYGIDILAIALFIKIRFQKS
ncbi:hypothetical protein NMS_0129 [Nonlabens marinus S1-08]|uniref:Uncharacterized protein n=2 Tax=Nonlabens TaxID=363408 RepID=W8VTZ4_9FLAO|nr:hypothetical protein NMS_0129 [Nonlabens marinus S1-08]